MAPISLALARAAAPFSSIVPAVACAPVEEFFEGLAGLIEARLGHRTHFLGNLETVTPIFAHGPTPVAAKVVHSPVPRFARDNLIDDDPRRYDAAAPGSISWTLDRGLQEAQRANRPGGCSRIKVIAALTGPAAGGPWTCRLPAGDTKGSLRLSAIRPPGLTPSPMQPLERTGHFTTMNHAEFQLRGVGDPRLAVHATSALPAWLWSIDGTRILWANPVGARLFGAANGAELAKQNFWAGGPAPPAGGATRRPAARLRRDPAGAAARLWRAARRAADLRLRAARICRRRPRHPGGGRETRGPRDAAGGAAAVPGRRHRFADRGFRARRHVRRRQRRRAPAARLSQSVRGRSRCGAQRCAGARAASRRRSASVTWCCSGSAAAPMSAWSR